jgi:hypothetical protein
LECNFKNSFRELFTIFCQEFSNNQKQVTDNLVEGTALHSIISGKIDLYEKSFMELAQKASDLTWRLMTTLKESLETPNE